MSFGDRAIFEAHRVGAKLARGLPEDLIPGAERSLGSLGARVMPGRRAQVERNIARVYGSGLSPNAVDSIVRETFTSYVRYWIESFRLPGTAPEVIDAGVTISNFAAITSGLEAGNGVIIALPHLGGWECGAFWLGAVHRIPVTAVAEAIEPPELAEWFVSLRASLGMELIALGPGAGTACARALKANRVVCLVCDRDLAGGGVEVDFFGETTTLPGGPATLALRSGAPLLTAATYFEGRSHHFVIDEPVDTSRRGRLGADVERVTADVAQRLEALIREAPEQWHLLQPNWPSDRVGTAAPG